MSNPQMIFSTPLRHSRPPDTRVLTTELPLIEYFALIRAAKIAGLDRVAFASKLMIEALKTAGQTDEYLDAM